MLDILHQHASSIIAIGYLLLELLAIVAAVHAVMNVRTAQGAVAWFIALITVPLMALPFYAVFGRRRFLGYVAARREGDEAIKQLTEQLSEAGREPTEPATEPSTEPDDYRIRGFETITGTPFLDNNTARLLIDGPDTFEAIFAAIEDASNYVLVQFYIVRDDELGLCLQQKLLHCLARGVRVYLLYDAIGSHQLGSDYVEKLRASGGQVVSFTGSTRRVRRLQINFRNHRKLVVVDGRTAFVGGHNVGDAYLGKHPRLTPWRDTHVEVRGPVATALQVPFVEDWHWSTGEVPEIQSQTAASASGHRVLSLPSSPADSVEAGGLMFVHAISAARKRLWIVSPYFVPNGSIIDALLLAALRGVDVRILLPSLTDNRLAQLAGRAYLPELLPVGVRVFRYTSGFLHQKVMLIDDDLATIGTANLDNRSMRLNFELTLVFAGEDFAREVEAMLITDFEHSEELDSSTVAGDPWWRQAAARGARLLAPVL